MNDSKFMNLWLLLIISNNEKLRELNTFVITYRDKAIMLLKIWLPNIASQHILKPTFNKPYNVIVI